MRILMLSALFCTAVGAAVLAAPNQTKDKPATQPSTQPSAKPINKFCAVEHDNEIDPKVTFLYQGKAIGFCCKDCIDDFKKDPKKYMANLK